MKKIARISFYCLFVFVLFAPAALSQGLARTTPRAAGLSEDRLAEITALMQEHVDDNKLAGAVAVVARRGKVAYMQSVGKQDIEADIDMSPDTIFRIASMTKPITSVAVLMLCDEGLVRLTDPVSKYIPEFADPAVLGPDPQDGKTIPAKRQITIKHLLTHTSGLTYHWNRRLGQMYQEAGITHGLLQDDSVLAVKMSRLARLPLLHQPGEAWEYGLSVDVLGRVVEVASGKTLEEFFEQRIFGPLEMKDTHFFIPAEKMGRLAAVYAPKPEGGLKRLDSEPVVEGSMVYSADHPYRGRRRYFSGGGGLCSTVGDYLRFSQMLLNGGTRQTTQSQHGPPDDHRSSGPAQQGTGFRPRRQRDQELDRGRRVGLCRLIRMGRILVYDLLRRPEQEDDRNLHGPVASGRRCDAGQRIQTSGV